MGNACHPKRGPSRRPKEVPPLPGRGGSRGDAGSFVWKPRFFARISAAFLVLLFLGQSAWAQGCILCYTTASSLNKKGIHALDKAILVIGLPAVILFIGIFVYIYRRRNAWRAASAGDATS